MPGANKWGSEFLINTITAGNQEHPTVTALGNGRFVVTWLDNSHAADDPSGGAIRAQVFNADGSKLGGEFRVNTTVHNHQSEPAIAALADGRFVVTWADESQSGGDTSESAVRAQVFNPDGTKSGSEFLIPATTQSYQSHPTITGLADGRFVAAWTDDSETGGDTDSGAVRARIFNADGTPSSSEFLVNTTTAESQERPTITALANGNFVVAWSDLSASGGDLSDYAVRAQVFQADGAPLRSELLINTATNGSQHEASITGLADGRFVVAWADISMSEGDLDGFAVRARIFEADGAPSTGEFVVNTTTDGWQLTPKIAALPDGRFVASWVDTSTGENQFRAQVFNTDGSKSGGELVVAAPASTSDDHTITALADGRFVISWSGVHPAGGDASGLSVRAQIFDPRETAMDIAGTSGDDDLVGTGFGDILGGGEGNDRLSGDGGNDELNGGAGTDTMLGGAGNDGYHVDNAGDVVIENSGEGIDTVYSLAHFRLGANVENLVLQGSADLQGYGNGLANMLTGNAGSNLLDGDAGVDIMIGGLGNDVYFVDSGIDAVIEKADEGFDTVYSTDHLVLGDNVENLSLIGGDLQGYGNALNNVLTGTAGANLLDGRGGNDQMFGGLGNDLYFVDSGLDAVFENADEGFDTVHSTDHLVLGDNVENLTLIGGDLQGYGNAFNNVLVGTAGANLLDGRGGNDQMFGGLGNDAYFVDSGLDAVFENANGGLDIVFSTDHLVLGDNVEYLRLMGNADLQGYGNALANILYGNDGDNLLDGRAGADTLEGGNGNDTFMFNAGQANGDIVVDFAGNGAGAGDFLLFVGYGAGATFTNIDATHWQVNYNGGLSHDIITFADAASVHLSDYAFV